MERFERAMNEWKGNVANGIDMEINETVNIFMDNIRNICDKAMKKRTESERNRKNVYWWDEKAARARKECILARRKWQRCRKKDDRNRKTVLAWTRYREVRNVYRKVIKGNRLKSWKNLIRDIDNNTWGMAYHIVMNKVGRKNLPILDIDETMAMMKELFPEGHNPDEEQPENKREKINMIRERMGQEMEIQRDEVIKAIKRINVNKAPGPDKIPGKMIKLIGLREPEMIRKVMQRCMNEMEFPKIWKMARVVLIPKMGADGKVLKYRAICLIDVIGKIWERIIANRIVEHVERNERMEKGQYGFRTGRATVDAVMRLKQVIKDKKGKRKKGLVENRGEIRQFIMSRGVPQGSVLGPLLWNIAFDGVMEKMRVRYVDVETVCYADDTAFLVSGDSTNEVLKTGERVVREFIERVKEIGLEIAREKTEFIVFRNKMDRYEEHEINIDEYKIKNSLKIKYLGVNIDDKLVMGGHVKNVSERATCAMASLGRIMPNLKGPAQEKRKILTTVAMSIVMYASQAWQEVTKFKRYRAILERIRRLCCIRVCAAYRTVPAEAIGVLSGIPPFDLIAKCRGETLKAIRENMGFADKRIGVIRRAIKTQKKMDDRRMMMEWKERWDKVEGSSNNWTKRLIPDITQWVNRRHGQMNYYLTQAFTGHGTFNAYLKKKNSKKRRSAQCRYCEWETDNAEHSIFECSGFNSIRADQWVDIKGQKIRPETLLAEMLRKKNKWETLSGIITRIIQIKDTDDREMGNRGRSKVSWDEEESEREWREESNEEEEGVDNDWDRKRRGMEGMGVSFVPVKDAGYYVFRKDREIDVNERERINRSSEDRENTEERGDVVKVAQELLGLTYKVKSAYAVSGNLNREIKKNADKEIQALAKELYAVTRTGEEEIVTDWVAIMTKICEKVISNRRFSEEIAIEMKRYVKTGSNVVAGYMRKTRDIDRKKRGEKEKSKDQGKEESKIRMGYDKTQRREIMNYEDNGRTGIRMGSETARKSAEEREGALDKGMMDVMIEELARGFVEETQKGKITRDSVKKRKRVERKESDLDISQTDRTPPSKKAVIEGTMKANADREGGRNRGNGYVVIKVLVDRREANSDKEVKSKYKDKLKEIKEKIIIVDEKIVGVKKCFNSEDVLIMVENMEDANKIVYKLREAEQNVSILSGRKRRMHIQGMDASVEDQELKKELSEQIGVGSGDIKIIFRREGLYGLQTACVEVPEKTLIDYLKKEGYIRIGWNRCRAREFIINNRCFRCGDAGHRAIECRTITEKECYKCGQTGHLVGQCKEVGGVRDTKNGIDIEGVGRNRNLTGKNKNDGRDLRSEREVDNEGTRRNRYGVMVRNVGTQTNLYEEIKPTEQMSMGDNKEEWRVVVGRRDKGRMVGKDRGNNGEKEAGLIRIGDKERNNKAINGESGGKIRKKVDTGMAIHVNIHGKNVMETIALLKRNMECSTGEKGIKRVRGTRNGGVLFEIEEKAEVGSWKDKIIGAIGKDMDKTIRVLSERVTVKIRGMDPLIEENEVINAIRNNVELEEFEEEQIQVVRTFIEMWQEKVMLVRMPIRVAEKLQDGDGVRIGWTRNKVRILKNPEVRCWKCGMWGHATDMCKREANKARRESNVEERQIHRNERKGRECNQENNREHEEVENGDKEVILANMNNSKTAQNLLQRYMVEERIQVAFITEPAKEGSGVWYRSSDNKVAVYVNGSAGVVTKMIEQDRGFIVIWVDGIVFIVGYSSPNISNSDFVNFWDKIRERIRGLTISCNKEVIILGDYNAQDFSWADRSDVRGRVITETMNEMNLYCMNTWNVKTCRRHNGSSTIDIVLGSEKVKDRIVKWRVAEEETLSDHRYVEFEITDRVEIVPKERVNRNKNKNVNRNNNRREMDNNINREIGNVNRNVNNIINSKDKGWKESSFRMERFERAMNEWKGNVANGIDMEINETVNIFMDNIRNICDKAMKKRTESERNRKNVYWWDEKAARARKECILARRKWQRCRKKDDRNRKTVLAWTRYREVRNVYRKVIKGNRLKSWKNLIRDIDNNTWGMAYHIVMNKVGRKNLPILDIDETMAMMKELFPEGHNPDEEQPENKREKINMIRERMGQEMEIQRDEVIKAIKRINVNKAPGPDKIPGKMIKLIGLREPEMIRKVMQRCMNEMEFPKIWKMARVVLIPKMGADGKVLKYRAICLIDVIGKIWERIIANRIVEHVERNERMEKGQYGFRTGRATVDAVMRLKQVIKDKKGKRKKGLVENRGEIRQFIMSRGVPQGSVLGPLLWNIAFDGVMEKMRVRYVDVETVCYADDTAFLVSGDSTNEVLKTGERVVREFIERVKEIGLEIAREKTEFIVFRNKMDRYEEHEINIDEYKIKNSLKIKYLGVNIDDKLVMGGHVKNVSERATCAMASLGRIMPNLKGPAQEKRKILTTVAMSIVMYASQAWQEVTKFKRYRAILERIRRLCCIRVCAAYRTVPAEAIGVLSGIPPFDLIAKCRGETLKAIRENMGFADKRIGVIRRAIKTQKKMDDRRMMMEWKERWDRVEGSSNNWTKRLIPDITQWVNRRHGQMNYYLTQAFTGHGTFNAYLKKFKKRRSAQCRYCEWETDNAEHSIFECSGFNSIRADQWVDIKGQKIRPETLLAEMLRKKNKWETLSGIITRIIQIKDNDDREMGF
ncbi:unnamed protein product [Xylocopa violacea]|uniref:Reverse transcriptase domain-containing protein n=2 Tax=Xylocopa violacea TaxID=135666 RepID=A0ABP1MVW1_XYLVO